MKMDDLLNALTIGEDQDIEFKRAEGGLPKSLWETASAFANSGGGYIVLGVTEHNDRFSVSGLKNPANRIKVFWDIHNNPKKLSVPLCTDRDVTSLALQGKNLVIIRIPQAHRTQRPVFINGNPLGGTFKRNYEGDYHCPDFEVRQMLRDASDEPQDLLVLDGFDFNDLDIDTIKAFRQRFSSREPDHPFLALNDRELLYRLGGWHRDRQTLKEGLTLAGLLMFGKERSILDAFPHYQLDYQEQLSEDPEQRWTYRLTLDGRWEANLFNFFFRAFGRLVEGLAVPFQLEGDAVRRGETHVHEALREALVNCLVHADHRSSRPITIIKRRNAFLFSNPGRLRIPLPRLYEGGVSDPRNPNLHKMFQMLGLGEKAGSGFQKILRAWREQCWAIPLVSEKTDLDMTSVMLPVVSLIPDDVEKELRGIVGDAFASLHEIERIILVLAHRLGEVSNTDVQPYCREHPKEIGNHLNFLVIKGWLDKAGTGRGTVYRLPGMKKVPNLPLFELVGKPEESSEHYPADSEHYGLNSEHSTTNAEQYSAEMLEISAPIREKRRAGKELVRSVILELCSEQFLLLRALAKLLKRSPETIRTHYLIPMVRAGLLKLKYPAQLNHPKQAYKATGKKET